MKYLRIATSHLVCAACLCGGMLAQTQHAKLQTEERINRIEHDLLPPVAIRGRAITPSTVAERMRYHHVPGVSVAFIDHGRIAWTRVYGLADIASQTPVTPDTLFQAASISKPITAIATMRLVQDGKLKLDEDVNQQLRSWKIPENGFTQIQKVTLRRLLSHTAGTTVSGFRGYDIGAPLPNLEQVLDGKPPANNRPIRVDTVPGTLWRYSGGGYVVVRRLLEDVTGKSFAELMHDLVLGPVGMEHSSFEQPLPKDKWVMAAMAYGQQGQPYPNNRFFVYPELAPDGLWTTPSDIARFVIEVQNEYSGTSSKIVNQTTIREMLQREMIDWGMGFQIQSIGRKPYFRHTGSNQGMKSTMVAYDAKGLQGIVIMTNGEQGSFRGEYIRAVAKEYSWPDFQMAVHSLAKIDSSIYAKYAGTYMCPELGILKLSLLNGRLYANNHELDLANQELLPESSTKYFVLSDDITFKFSHDGSGKITGIKLIYRTVPYELKKE